MNRLFLKYTSDNLEALYALATCTSIAPRIKKMTDQEYSEYCRLKNVLRNFDITEYEKIVTIEKKIIGDLFK